MDTVLNASVAAQTSPKAQVFAWFSARSAWQRWLMVIAAWILLIVLGYCEEDWRGRRAWENYKAASAAKGVSLDWSANIPPSVPASENFFDAPDMTHWFVGRGGNSLSGRLGYSPRANNLHSEDAVAVVTIAPATATVTSDDADIVLRFCQPFVTLSTFGAVTNSQYKPGDVIPLIVMDEVPLRDAIKNLARQEGISYYFDPEIRFREPGIFGGGKLEPLVNLRWENLTAQQALVALLNQYELQITPNFQTGIARISMRVGPVTAVQMDAATARQLGNLIRAAAGIGTNDGQPTQLTSPLGYQFTAAPLHRGKTARIVVRTVNSPSVEQIKNFFPGNFYKGSYNATGCHVDVQPGDDTKTFRVFLTPQPVIDATEYLAWTDSLQPEFDQIREALKRPYARMPGDYEHSESIPIPNFVCVRMLSQTLAQRTQSYLLLGQPDKALQEITLLHDLCRLMEARPTGRPMTLVAAMINVAVTGMYVGVVADGMNLHVWRAEDLATLQEQLRQTDLEPYVAGAFKFEPAAHARVVEHNSPKEFADLLVKSYKTSPVDALKDSTYWYLLLAPRGWILQNLQLVSKLEDRTTDSLDVEHHLVRPRITDAATDDVLDAVRHITPFNVLAKIMVPNFSRAVQTFARNQTLVNEGFIVCALERYKLAHGQYPKTLDALAPEFVASLPHDLIGGESLKYHLEDDKFVLYSVGWNETDDGGVPSFSADFTGELTRNDWVWPYGQEAQNKM